MENRKKFFKDKNEITATKANEFYQSIIDSAEYLDKYNKQLEHSGDTFEKIIEEKRTK